MGIRGGAKEYFCTKLLDVLNSGIKRVHLSKFRGKKVVIDWSNIAHRFLSRSNNMAQFINEFINLIHKFSRERIEMIFVFDGKPRDEKQQTIDHRKTARDKVLDKIGSIIENVTNPEEDFETILHLAKRVKTLKLQHVNECKKLFDSLGVRYIHLEDIEADSIFKILLDSGIADICFSGDMDILAFGCKRIMQDLNFREDTVVEIDYEILLTYLGVSSQQLLMAFILSGTDWNNGIKRSNFARNLELIKKYGDIPTIIANLEEINRYLPEEKHIGFPNRFDWQFSFAVYSELLGTEILYTIHNILIQQEKNIENLKSQDGYNILLEYGKFILANDSDLKYTKKFQEYTFWKYSYRFNFTSPSGFKQKAAQCTDLKQVQKKVKN